MLYGEIIAVCSEIHTKHTNRLWRQNEEFFSLKLGGTYSNHCGRKGLAQRKLQTVLKYASFF
jgi:hypothetical protein